MDIKNYSAAGHASKNCRTPARLTVVSLAFLLSACSQPYEEDSYESTSDESAITTQDSIQESSDRQNEPLDPAMLGSHAATTIQNGSDISHNLAVGGSATQTNKPLAVSMEAQFLVNDVVDVVSHIEQLTQKYQGYVALSNIGNEEGHSTRRVQGDVVTTITPYQRYANMELQIPRRHVSAFLAQLQADIKFLQSSKFIAMDQTFEIYLQQLEAALKKEMADELKQQRLTPTETNSEDQSKNQSSNLNSIEATYKSKRRQALAQVERLRLQDSVDYSALVLNFTQPEDVYQTRTKNVAAIIEAAGPSFSMQLADSFKDGLEGLKTFVLWFASLWWFWLLLIFSVPILKRLFRFWCNDKVLSGNKDKNKQDNDEN